MCITNIFSYFMACLFISLAVSIEEQMLQLQELFFSYMGLFKMYSVKSFHSPNFSVCFFSSRFVGLAFTFLSIIHSDLLFANNMQNGLNFFPLRECKVDHLLNRAVFSQLVSLTCYKKYITYLWVHFWALLSVVYICQFLLQ